MIGQSKAYPDSQRAVKAEKRHSERLKVRPWVGGKKFFKKCLYKVYGLCAEYQARYFVKTDSEYFRPYPALRAKAFLVEKGNRSGTVTEMPPS